MPHNDAPSTRMMRRFTALIQALRDGPLPRPDLLERLGDAYPAHKNSRRVMVDRDVKCLRELGIIIDISRTRPPIYTLHGGTPAYSADDLRTLALVRDSFDPKHPQSVDISTLLATLTVSLSAQQQAEYARRQVSRAPLQPAIDYTPHRETIARLEQAISGREIITFRYTNSEGSSKQHESEPYEIEYYERHFYLVAYNLDTRQILDYRIDRITLIQTVQTLPEYLSRTHERPTITFRYRLAPSLARGPLSQRFENQRIVERRANGVIIEAEGRSDFFIIRTLLKYAGNAELLEPAWLREKMCNEVQRLGEMYGVNGED